MGNTKGHRPQLKVNIGDREHLVPLAPGTVRPTGWVKRLAEIEASAWIDMIVQKDEFNFRTSFYDGSPTPHGGEWAGYWNESFIGLAILTENPKRLQEVEERVEAILEASEVKEKFLSEYYNGWGSHLMISGLLTYYEYSEDKRVLDLCHRIALELMDDLHSPEGTAFDGDHPVNMVSSCARIYGYTGDERMLDMAHEIAARFDAYGLPNISRLLHDDYLKGHCVNYCEDLRYPADLYLFSGNTDHLKASMRGVELTQRDHLQVQGVPTGNEMVYGKGPFKETEHCDTVEWSFVGHSLLAATGDSRFADLAEKALFNAWAGSRKWDGKNLAYNHAPNQITAASWEGAWKPRRNLSPHHVPLCCNLNSHRAIFPYASRMWMLAANGGPAAVYYGDCLVQMEMSQGVTVELVESTGYPLDEEVRIEVNPDEPAVFPVSLRIPSWCKEPEVEMNGEVVSNRPHAGTFYVIERRWQKGDIIKLTLPMPVKLEWCELLEETPVNDVNQTDADTSREVEVGLRETTIPVSGLHLVGVIRGPLVYSLYIKPESLPESVKADPDAYLVEDIVPHPDAEPWNLALLLNQDAPDTSFELIELNIPEGSAPFQHPAVALKCKARVVSDWVTGGTREKPETSLPDLPIYSLGETVEATLVPFGCTNIRLTWLPFVFY